MSRRALPILVLACLAALPTSALGTEPLSASPASSSGSPAPTAAAKATPVAIAAPAAGVFPALEISGARGQAQAPEDDTLRAMKDEMARSEARLQTADLGKPYFIDYRLLDIQVRAVTADFGSIVNSSTTRLRLMLVEVRMGNYHIDSSNFVTGGFQGSLSSSGQVGIDGDYYSLRQDLWQATDAAYKQAADQLARKQAYLNSQAKPPEIDDFARIGKPMVLIEPHAQPDWTSRDWDKEAEEASAVFRAYPDIYAGRVTYYLVYQTYYLLTSEGTELRVPSSAAGLEGAVETQAPDGMPLHDFYSAYALTPAGLPAIDQVKQHFEQISQQLEALRAAPAISDYDGPVLFEPQAAGSLLAQMLAPSLSGANPPLATVAMYEQMYSELGGRSAWTGRIGQRVLPTSVTLYDDPTAQEFNGQPLLGGYQVDAEGVPGQRVTIVRNGMLAGLLMSRRPGPDFSQSNGHGRAAGLGAPTPSLSNLFLTASDGLDGQAMKQKLIDICKSDGLPWCLVVKRMDNPALAAIHHDDFDTMLRGMLSGLSNGDRAPLVVERLYVSDGHEELVRGARIIGLSVNNLRNDLAAVGSDPAVFNFMQNPEYPATALAAFGSASGGLPSAVVTPSLLLRDIQVNGPHGGEQRLPLIPIPPMQ